MNNIFRNASSHWVRYDRYELKKAPNGKLYITPTKDAVPEIYDPLADANGMVIDAVNVGLTMMKQKSDAEISAAVMQFITHYGLLGLMTALPTTQTFMDYEAVYLPKNNFIKAESLSTDTYISNFYPFDKPELTKKGVATAWSTSSDPSMQALAATFSHKPLALNMSFQREYAEPYDWIAAQFKDWAFLFSTVMFYYNHDNADAEETCAIYRQAMAAFDGIAPSYHIELRERPTIVWDFHSLLLGIEMMLSFALADEQKSLRMCKQCQNAFSANRANAIFCFPSCKSLFNLQKK